MEAYDKALETHSGTIDGFWEWWWTTLEPLLPELPAEQRRRTFGDYETKSVTASHINRARPPFQLWDYNHIYDEKNLEVTSGGCSDTGLDFIDEIRQYFADILPQDHFDGDAAEECQEDDKDAISLEGITLNVQETEV
ncbi:hypothetical protein C8A01DRAFT_39129 [Parachaetomium inaequale]|uniref:Uncharacterized protein n=1 Tax=Parachaetomium inaequale TaxID=2588326 RepID=A0AAN6PCT8_9PEZI|nr:hypothetical protein C8A01DRAFT_39129 [Parachaetomium inaequale]